jgi:hypothetical protein
VKLLHPSLADIWGGGRRRRKRRRRRGRYQMNEMKV